MVTTTTGVVTGTTGVVTTTVATTPASLGLDHAGWQGQDGQYQRCVPDRPQKRSRGAHDILLVKLLI
jgi:hypothetical protein